MRQVWQALDGELFEEEQWCKEYEGLLEKALKAIEPIKFRTIEHGWNLDPEPIKQHPLEVVHKAWSDFLGVVKELILWSEMYTEYQNDFDPSPRDIQQSLLDQLDKYSEEHRVVYPIALWNDWPGFRGISQRFEAINMENGEEYIGSFGQKGMEGRKQFLEMIEESKKEESQ